MTSRLGWGWITGFVEIVLAFVMLVIVYRQMQIMGKQSEIMKRQTDIMNRQAESAITADRPWVGVVNYDATPIYPDMTEGKSLRVTLSLVNAGNRSAKDVRVAIRHKIYTAKEHDEDGIPMDFPLESVPVDSTHFLVPNAETSVSMDPRRSFDRISPEDVYHIRHGGQRLFIMAYITYQDPETNRTHWTRYCLYFHAEIGKYNACKKYNDAE